MRIAVTGGSGRIGRAVTGAACTEGHDVVSIDVVGPPPSDAWPSATYTAADVTRYDELVLALRDCDALIHLAAHVDPGDQAAHVVHNDNVVGSYNALAGAVEAGIRRVVLASSVNAIGASYSREPRFDYFPIDEHHPTYSEDPYSLSKFVAEQQADSIARRHAAVSIASLRIHMLVPDRATARKRSAHNPAGAVKHLWGYTRVDAVVAACLTAVTEPCGGHEVFWLVAPETVSKKKTAALARKHYRDVPIRGDLDGHRSFFDCSKAETLLGWKHPRD